jgi:outer membrane protein, heavy metal efflux system
MKPLHVLVVAILIAPPISLAQAPILATPTARETELQTVPMQGSPGAIPVAPSEHLPSANAPGEASRQLTLADLEAMALANTPTLTQAAARVDAARGRWVQGGLQLNPVIGYSAEEMGDAGTAGKQGAFVSQELINSKKLSWNRAVAGREIAESQQQFEIQRRRVLNDVRTQFYNVLLAQDQFNLSQRLLAIAGEATQTAERLFEAKEGNRVDLLQAQIEAEAATVAVESARNRYAAAWRRLVATVAVPEMNPIPLAGKIDEGIPTLSFEEAMERLLAESPELAASAAAIARARAALGRARVEPVPDYSLQATTHYDNVGGDTIAGVQAGISVPLWNRNQGGIREAQANLQESRAALLQTQLALQDRLAIAFESYANARVQVERYSTSILPKAQQSLQLINQGYRAGEFNFLTLLTAQRTYFQANLNYLNAVGDLRARAVEIDGLLLTGSLEERPERSMRPGRQDWP